MGSGRGLLKALLCCSLLPQAPLAGSVPLSPPLLPPGFLGPSWGGGLGRILHTLSSMPSFLTPHLCFLPGSSQSEVSGFLHSPLLSFALALCLCPVFFLCLLSCPFTVFLLCLWLQAREARGIGELAAALLHAHPGGHCLIHTCKPQRWGCPETVRTFRIALWGKAQKRLLSRTADARPFAFAFWYQKTV